MLFRSKIKEQVLPRLLERVDPEAAATLTKDELSEEFRPIIMEVLAELKVTLNRREQFALEKVLVDELLGFGPLEELLNDPDVSDIMVNGPDQTYIEKNGKLVIAPIKFRDETHLFQIAQRIVNQVGRRVDQTTPLADARLKDGSRVNVIVPPLSLRGTAISIRKFSDKPITLDMMAGFGSMSTKMATMLKIAGACRFNIVISGGTGSGKTTMLNALSKMIDPGERVLTIEDAAELRLQQACDAGVLAGRRAMQGGDYDSNAEGEANKMFAFNFPSGMYASSGVDFKSKAQGMPNVVGEAKAILQNIIKTDHVKNDCSVELECRD